MYYYCQYDLTQLEKINYLWSPERRGVIQVVYLVSL